MGVKEKNKKPGHTRALLVVMPKRQYELVIHRSRETKRHKETGEPAFEISHPEKHNQS